MLKSWWDKQKALSYYLNGYNFEFSVDLGSGPGIYGHILKAHTKHLVGVDYVSQSMLLQNDYDEFIQAQIQDYVLPAQCDSVFMLDSIEHMLEEEGQTTLEKIGLHRFILVTTPSKYRPSNPIYNPHISVWTQEKLEKLGFQVHKYVVYIFDRDLIALRKPKT